MNSIRQIRELNKRELENNVAPEASWHADYRDTAYIYIGGLPFELSEGDVVTIFSQFGEPTYLNLIRDKETGKSKGFAFLKYEDQRSTDLAVDNLGGAVVMGRTLKVDHTRYKKKEDEPEEGHDLTKKWIEAEEDEGKGRRKKRRTSESGDEEKRPMIKEEIELAKLIETHDDDDPMKQYMVQEKKEEVALALAKIKAPKKLEKSHKHRHRHRSSRQDDEDVKGYSGRRQRRSRSLERSSATRPESRVGSDEYKHEHSARRREDEGVQRSRRVESYKGEGDRIKDHESRWHGDDGRGHRPQHSNS